MRMNVSLFLKILVEFLVELFNILTFTLKLNVKFTTSFAWTERSRRKLHRPEKEFNVVCEIPNLYWTRVGKPSPLIFIGWDGDDHDDYQTYPSLHFIN